MPQDTAPKCKEINLDKILVEKVGGCGWFQLRVSALCLLVAGFAGSHMNLFLFTFAKVNTRCYIPECENSSSPTNFSSSWIFDAVPAVGDAFDNCRRFKNVSDENVCSAEQFNRNHTMECHKYVYEHTNSAVFEYNLACDSWRPNLVGSMVFFGNMLALPIGGFVADRWGRRVALACSGFNVAWIGAMLYFAPNYISYLLIGFLSELLGGSFYAVEYVGPQYRAVLTAALNSFTSMGMMIAGVIASTEPHWRNLILIIHCPMLVMLLYFWILPESIRWLISKNRLQEAETILKKVATTNGTQLSEKTLEALRNTEKTDDKEDIPDPWFIGLVFKHKPILLRCVVSSMCLFTCSFAETGLSIISTGLSGSRYLNNCLVALASVPGYWIAMVLLTKIGRKTVIVTALWMCGAYQLAYIFIPKDNYWISILVYLTGEVNVAATYTTMLVYSAELFPTQYRARLFAVSVTFSSIGGILSPLIRALAENTWDQLPFVIFGSLAFFAGCLTTLTPETFGTSLPDTIEEAADLGKGRPGIMITLRKIMIRKKSYTVQ